MSQELEITYIFESEKVQYFAGDLVSDIIPIRTGAARILVKLDNRSGLPLQLIRLYWPAGRPPFIQEENISPVLIAITDDNASYRHRGNFSFMPVVNVMTTDLASSAEREILGPDPTIINTDIPGAALAAAGEIRRVA